MITFLISLTSLFAITVLTVGRPSTEIKTNADKFEPVNFKQTRIIGGSVAAEGLVPYIVSIQTVFGEHICGGSIIAHEWILTAGHCMEWPKEYLKIATGTINWQKADAIYELQDVKVHYRYNKPMYHNDVALIRLATPIVFNARTQPIKLAAIDELKNGDKVLLSGWGSIKVWGPTADILNIIELKYMPNKKCATAVKKSAWLGDGHICSYAEIGHGSCSYDSGGPLVDKHGLLVGVVNWGEPCAVGRPDVYASVAYYHKWIICIMQEGISSEC